MRKTTDTLKTVNFNLSSLKENKEKELLKLKCEIADLKMNNGSHETNMASNRFFLDKLQNKVAALAKR